MKSLAYTDSSSKGDMLLPTDFINPYRYGFNDKEKDDEIKGNGNSYDYGARIYDPRLGRFLSIDPLASKFPFYTPYQFAGNKPIIAVDLDGEEEYVVIRWYNADNTFKSSSVIKINDVNDRPFGRTGVLYLTLNDNEISQSGLEHQLMASSNSKPVANNFRRTILGTGIAHFEKGEYKLGAGKGFMSNNFRNSFEKEAGELVNKGIADNPSGSGVLAKVAPLSEFIGFKQNSSKYLPNYDGNNNGKTNQQEVDNVVNKLANNPDYTISMTGGASSEGNASANYTLSQNRINTVMGVLQNAGIGASRINNTAQGSSNLLSTEPSQNSKQNESINRNVQVKYNGPPK